MSHGAVEGVGEIAVERVVVVERDVQPIIRPMEINTDGSIEAVTPFQVVPYGNGRLLMSLVFLSRPQNQEMRKAIARAVGQLVTEGRFVRGTW